MWLYSLKDLEPWDAVKVIQFAGGKGYGLTVVSKLALPCPGTWVVPSGLLREFIVSLSDSGIQVEKNSGENLFEAAARFITDSISEGVSGLPEGLYAVRSSGVIEDSLERSFAGIFESRLDVPRCEIPQAVAEVWMSGLGAKIREYSHTDGWPEIAVLIQSMVQARFSGVCFSIHPSPASIRENHNILIEIIPGAGERLVQGEATPVRLSGTYGSLSSCTDYPWLPQLLSAVKRLEETTGRPVDVEFAVDEAGTLWILQQRPVTEICRSFSLNMTGFKKAYKRTLCSLDIEFLIDGCARYLAPYLEVPVDLTGWMVMLTNPGDGQQELWINELADEAVIAYLNGQITSDDQYLDRLAAKYDHYHRKMLSWRAAAWADNSLTLIERTRDFFEFVVPLNAHYYAPMHILEALSAVFLTDMRGIDPETADDDFFALTTSEVTTLSGLLAARCAEFRKSILSKHGFLPDQAGQLSGHFRDELDLLANQYGFIKCHLPYEEEYSAEEIFEMVKTACDVPGIDEAASSRFTALTEKYCRSPRHRKVFQHLRHWLKIRNQQMEYLYSVYAKARPLLQTVGAVLGLSVGDIWNRDRAYILESLQQNRALPAPYRHEKLAIAHDGLRLVISDRLNIIFPSSADWDIQIKGKTVHGTGQVEGIVKVAFTPEEVEVAPENESVIIVSGMTTPDFVPLLVRKAVGLITDEGGILCHAAIIAREIKLPCIVGTGVATEKLQDGMKVKMDLDRGEVKII